MLQSSGLRHDVRLGSLCPQSRHRQVTSACPFGAQYRKSALASGLGFLWGTHVRPQRKKLLAGSALCGALDFPITRDERKTKWRKDSATAILAADLPLDGSAPTDTIYLVYQVPRSLVGDVHDSAGGGDRTADTNILEQLDFAGTDASFRIQIDTNTQGRE